MNIKDNTELIEVAEKYFFMIGYEPYLLFSLEPREEIMDFIYSLHEEWNIHNVEEEDGISFDEFLFQNIGDKGLLVHLNDESSFGYSFIDFNFSEYWC